MRAMLPLRENAIKNILDTLHLAQVKMLGVENLETGEHKWQVPKKHTFAIKDGKENLTVFQPSEISSLLKLLSNCIHVLILESTNSFSHKCY